MPPIRTQPSSKNFGGAAPKRPKTVQQDSDAQRQPVGEGQENASLSPPSVLGPPLRSAAAAPLRARYAAISESMPPLKREVAASFQQNASARGSSPRTLRAAPTLPPFNPFSCSQQSALSCVSSDDGAAAHAQHKLLGDLLSVTEPTRALGLARQAGPKDAIEILQQVTSLHPRNEGLRFELGLAQYNAGRYVEAQKSFDAIEQPSPALQGNLAYMRGKTQLYQGNLLAAEQHLNQALQLQPSHPAVAKWLAITYAKMGRYIEAERALYARGPQLFSLDVAMLVTVMLAKRGLLGLAARNAKHLAQAPNIPIAALLVFTRLRVQLLQDAVHADLISDDHFIAESNAVMQNFVLQARLRDPNYVSRRAEILAQADRIMNFELP